MAQATIQIKLNGDRVVVSQLGKVKRAVLDVGDAAAKSSGKNDVFMGTLIGNLTSRGISLGIQTLRNVAHGVVDLGVASLQSSAQFELMSKQLEGVFKSSEGIEGALGKANAALEYTTQLAKEGPFQIEDLTRSFVRLKGAGIQGVESLLEGAVDATAAFGGTSADLQSVALALAQIASKGKLSGQELRQIAEKNIPIYKLLQDQLGLTGDEFEMLSQSGIDSEVALRAISRAFNDGFGGAAADQVDTLRGRFTNLQVAFGEVQRAVVDSGLSRYFKDLFLELTNSLDAWRESKDGAEAFGRSVLGVVKNIRTLVGWLQDLYENADKIIMVLSGLVLGIGTVAEGIGALAIALEAPALLAMAAGFEAAAVGATGVLLPALALAAAAYYTLAAAADFWRASSDKAIAAMTKETSGTNIEIQFAEELFKLRQVNDELDEGLKNTTRSMGDLFKKAQRGVEEIPGLTQALRNAEQAVKDNAEAERVLTEAHEASVQAAEELAEAEKNLAEAEKKRSEEAQQIADQELLQAQLRAKQAAADEKEARKTAEETKKRHKMWTDALKELDRLDADRIKRLKEEKEALIELSDVQKELAKQDAEFAKQIKEFTDAWADLDEHFANFVTTSEDVAGALSSAGIELYDIEKAFDAVGVSITSTDVSAEQMAAIIGQLSDVEMVAFVKALRAGELALDAFKNETKKLSDTIKSDLTGALQSALSDTFTSILQGDAVDAWESLWEELSRMAGNMLAENIGDAISVAMGGSAEGTVFAGGVNAEGEPVSGRGTATFVAIAGIAAQLAAGIDDARTAAVVSGAAAGAIAGFQYGASTGNPWAAVVGAVIGAAAAYFGSPSTPDPENYQFSRQGGNFQSYGPDANAPGYAQAAQEMSDVFQSVRAGWISVLEIFNTAELFDLVEHINVPVLVGTGYADEIQDRINDFIEITIPQAIAEAFTGAIQAGGSELFAGTEFQQGIADFFSGINLNLPAESVLQAFRDFVSVFVNAAAAIEGLQADNLLELVRTSAFERAFTGVTDVFQRIDTSMAALAILPLSEQAAQADKIIGLIATAAQAVASMLEAIAKASEAIDASVAAQSRSIDLAAAYAGWEASGSAAGDVGPMTGYFPGQISDILFGDFASVMDQLQTAVDPSQIQTLTAEAQSIINEILQYGNEFGTQADLGLQEFFDQYGIDFSGNAASFDPTNQLFSGSFTQSIQALLEAMRSTAQERLVSIQDELLAVNERLIQALEDLIWAILYGTEGRSNQDLWTDGEEVFRRRPRTENQPPPTGPAQDDPGSENARPPQSKGGADVADEWEKTRAQVAMLGDSAMVVAVAMVRAATMIESAAASIGSSATKIATRAQRRTGSIGGPFR